MRTLRILSTPALALPFGARTPEKSRFGQTFTNATANHSISAASPSAPGAA